MNKRRIQNIKRKLMALMVVRMCLFLCIQPEVLADTMYMAQRERAIARTIGRLTHQQIMEPELTAKLEYMQAEAYYLYTQGMFEDAIVTWKKIIALDEDNETALYYIEETREKINAKNKTKKQEAEEKLGIKSVRQKVLGPTQGQYSHTRTSYNEVAPHFTMGENRFFDHSISVIRNEQEYAIRTDRETTSIMENIRADTSFGDYYSSLTASALYDHSTRDDFRFLRHVNFMVENDNIRFIMGDTSTYLSRYVLNGMNFRGVEFMMNTDETKTPVDRFKILYGLGKSFDTQSEEYFYPIEIFGIRNEVELTPRYKFGGSFSYQTHEDKITRVDSLFRPRRNMVGSLDQYIKLADWWIVRHELAYSRIENEVSNLTVRKELPITEDWAHYITSNILRDKWQLYNTYEYGGPNFISLIGEARFLHNLVLNDKELFENTLVYTPTDELLFELHHYRSRNNLHSEATKETTKEQILSGLARIRPKNWLPVIGLRTSLLRARSTPGSDNTTGKRYAKDLSINLQKTLLGVDWDMGYMYQRSNEDLNNKFATVYRNVYSMGGRAAIIPDTTYFNASYSYADLDVMMPIGDTTCAAYEGKFDTSLSSRLWGTANLSLGYHYFNRRDYVGILEELDSHTGSFVFNWPYTKEFPNNRKLTMTPYLSYYYTKNDEFTNDTRAYFASKIDANYYFNLENRLNLMLEFKEGLDGSTLNQGGEEIRLMATYRSAFGL